MKKLCLLFVCSASVQTPGETEFALDPVRLRFKPTFTAGVFLPLFSRIVLNVAYDTRPNLIFVGLAISDPFNYEDLDMW
jgi:hypothetical protein